MFFRRGNKVIIDFLESTKESRTGIIDEFNDKGIVIKSNNKTSYIPFTSVSEIVLEEEVSSNGNFKTQF